MNSSRLAFTIGCLGLLAVAINCGSAGDIVQPPLSAGPCSNLYAGSCGRACATDVDCASGLFCGPTGTCAADCADGYACMGNLTCSLRGRCRAADPSTTFAGGDGGVDPVLPPASNDAATAADTICADVDVTLTRVLPKVLFLLDQSASMHYYKFESDALSNNCSPNCRWSVLKDVLIGDAGAQGGLLKQIEAEAEIAVQMYSATDGNPNDGDNSNLPGPTDNVCPRFNGKAFSGLTFAKNAFASVNTLLRPATVDDDTPTGPAIRTVVGLTDDGGVNDAGFAAITGPAPKVVVLVTDGEPMLCGESAPSDGGRASVISAVQQTYAQQIRTFVIAIGNTTPAAKQHFNAVANAGQGLDPSTGDAGAILPSSPQQLVDALRGIVQDARTCTVDLRGTIATGLERLGTVTLNGTTVPFDEAGLPDEGWRLITPSRIELVGTACTVLKATENAQLSARFPCGAIVVPPPPIPTDPK